MFAASILCIIIQIKIYFDNNSVIYYFRAYIREIINIRTTTYSKIKRSHPVDSYVDNFINNRIKPLWPNGWMKTSIIWREFKVKEKDSR